MGQRLVLTVRTQEMEEGLVNVYKHWSAYTGSAIEETNEFIEAYQQWAALHPKEKEIFGKTDEASINRQKEIIAMIMMDAWPGAHPAGFGVEDGVDEEQYEDDPEALEKHATEVKMALLSKGMFELASRLDDKFRNNRNDGLIGITERAIKNYQDWSEGDVEIIIENNGDIQCVYFGVMWGETWEDAVKEEASEDDLLECTYQTDYVNNDDFGVFNLDEWYRFVELCDKAWDAGKYKLGSKKNNSVWSFIE